MSANNSGVIELHMQSYENRVKLLVNSHPLIDTTCTAFSPPPPPNPLYCIPTPSFTLFIQTFNLPNKKKNTNKNLRTF